MLLRKQHRRHWRVFAVVAALLGAVTFYEAASTYESTTNQEEVRLQTLARSIDSHLQQQMLTIDRVLEDLAGEVAVTRLESSLFNQRLATLTQAMPSVRTLIVTDRDGTIRYASRPDLLGLSVAQRSFFTIPKTTPDPSRLYVTPPFATRLENHWVLPITRIVPGPGGAFGGIVEATIDPEFLSANLAAALATPDSQATLIHGDGVLVMHAPSLPKYSEINLNDGPTLFSAHRAGDMPASIQTGSDGISGEERFAALRTVAPRDLNVTAPLVVSVSRGVDAIYAPWYAKMMLEVGGVLIILLGSAAALRHYQGTQTETETRFGHLIDHAPYGIMLIDAGGAIRRANQAFTTLTGYTADTLLTVSRWRELAYPDANYRQHVAKTLAAQLEAAAGGDVTNKFAVRTAAGDDRTIKFVETQVGSQRMVMLEDVTEHERLAGELRDREALLSKIFDTASVAIFLVDRHGIITHANQRMAEMFGCPLDTLIGSEYVARIHPAERDVGRQKMLGLLASEIQTVDLERLYWREDGSQFWGHLTGRRFQDADGRELGLIGVISDIDLRKKAAQRHAGVIESAMDGFLIAARDGRIKECNQVFIQLTGYGRDELLQRRLADLGAPGAEAGITDRLAAVVGGARERFEARLLRKDGTTIDVEITASFLDLGDELCAFVRDITVSKAHQRELDRIAHYDALTGLPNRTLLADRMTLAAAQTRRAGALMAVCYLDLDGFKPINDRYGHAAGDQVLIEVAQRLQDCLRGGDTVARIGGDEFVLMLLGLTRADEDAALQRILDAVAAPLTMTDGAQVQVSASLGVAIYPRDDADIDILLRHADQAMYRAKRAGKNCYRLFDAQREEAPDPTS